MAELSKELPSGVIEQTKIRLAAHLPQLQILRPGEFCKNPIFLETLDPAILDVVAKPNAFTALENSIALGSVAVRYVQKDDPNRGIVISMFARTLRRRWQLKKEEDDYLDQAIYYFQKTIELEPVDAPNRPLHFDDLGCSHRDRYLRRRKPEDFDAAKLAFESAASIPHSGEPMFLSNLGQLLKDKALFVQNERRSLLEESLDAHLRAIACVTPEYRGVVQALYRHLVETYLDLYSIDGDALEDGFRGKVEEVVNASGKRWMFLCELGCNLGTTFRKNGLQNDIKNSVSLLPAALKEVPGNRIVISALIDALEQQGMSLQSQEILTEAHELSESVISSMHDFHPELLSRLQSDTVVLTRRFEYNGNLEDLTKGYLHYAKSSRVSNTRNPKKTEKKDDTEAAITFLQAAVEVEGLSPADKAISLDEYGKVLFARFKLNNKNADLEQAIKAYKETLEIWGSENDSIVSCMNNLGNAMVMMFEMTADPRELPSGNHSSYGRPRRTGTFSSHFS